MVIESTDVKTSPHKRRIDFRIDFLSFLLACMRRAMPPGLLHYRRKGTRTFIFYFEGGAHQFASFLERWGIAYEHIIDLGLGQNVITIK